MSAPSLRYIDAKTAQAIDDQLMSPSEGAFSLDQLMELAGLACATALGRTFPLPDHKKVLVMCGPGNQGGDGLVAARHLAHFGYTPTVYLPKFGKNPFYESLKKQVTNLDILVISSLDDFKAALGSSDCALDAIFGFSFHPPLRDPFTDVLPLLSSTSVPILSVDIPSGWDVSLGPLPTSETSFPALQPHALISLTAPKEGVRYFKGKKHWLGGRFVPPAVDKKFSLNLPPYPGLDAIVEIPALGETKASDDDDKGGA